MLPCLILAVALAGKPVAILSDAEPSTRLAASELTNYLFRITGKTSEVKVKGEGEQWSSPSVVIGTVKTLGEAVPAAARKALAKTDNIEAAWTGTDGGKVWIVGKNEVAELYATYHFLESKLGVRWFQAWTKDDPGDYVPRDADLAVADFAEFREPKFRIRRLDKYRSYGDQIATNGQTCALRNGYQLGMPYGGRIPYEKPDSDLCRFYSARVPFALVDHGGDHMTFVLPQPPSREFAKHPEWFALVGGKRVKGNEYCISNPEVRQRTADYILKLFDRDGGAGQFLFGMWSSTWGSCECANCRALDGTDVPQGDVPNVSSRYNATVDWIAERIWAKYPKADLRLWAHHIHRRRPEVRHPDPRLKVCVSEHNRCYAHALGDPRCARNVKALGILKEWTDVAPTYVYSFFSRSNPLYTPNELTWAEDLRTFRKLGMLGLRAEGTYSDSRFVKPSQEVADEYPSMWQTLYVAGHLLWDPDLDEKALLADAESKYYGAAYPAMKKYHDLRRRLWSVAKGCMGYPRADDRRPGVLNAPGAKEELLALLDEAEGLLRGAEDVAPYRVRLARDRRFLQTYWIAPCEAFQAKMATALHVGSGAWTVMADLLCRLETSEHFPEALRTTVEARREGEAICFRLTARDPDAARLSAPEAGSVWDGDCMEVMLAPPDGSGYWHWGVSPQGRLAAEASGKKADDGFGATASARILADRYVVELRLPLQTVHPLVAGDVWKFNVCRSRVSGVGPARKEEHYSIGGINFLNVANYHPLVVER